MRTGAWALVAAGVAVPLLRRRLRIPPPVVTATAVAAPFAMCVAVRRSRARDVATLVLQMWGYIAHYEMPNDDPEALQRRGGGRNPPPPPPPSAPGPPPRP